MISSPIVALPDTDEADAPAVDLSCVSCGDTLRMRLAGEVDHFTATPLRVVLTTAAAYGYRHLDLDTRAITFCDSALLDALAGWCRSGRTVSHTATSRPVGRLLAMERDLGRPSAPGAWKVTGR
ncbi:MULTISPECIES: STAS domain-containing protein [Streptomyces]|uniref:STAS domain-containing protein n=1 Tax=Streptomyces omiyaensis TaxID=68247 RepID=A0ABW7BRG2_9ACTN|nr:MULTISPECIES: STAS domain-containing protein [Streptomyces]